MNNDLISREVLNDIWELYKKYHRVGTNFHEFGVALKDIIDNAPTVARTERPFVMIDGKAIYITQGHIDAMVEYEKQEQIKEVVERFIKSFEEEEDNDNI